MCSDDLCNNKIIIHFIYTLISRVRPCSRVFTFDNKILNIYKYCQQLSCIQIVNCYIQLRIIKIKIC